MSLENYCNHTTIHNPTSPLTHQISYCSIYHNVYLEGFQLLGSPFFLSTISIFPLHNCRCTIVQPLHKIWIGISQTSNSCMSGLVRYHVCVWCMWLCPGRDMLVGICTCWVCRESTHMGLRYKLSALIDRIQVGFLDGYVVHSVKGYMICLLT